MAGPIKPNKKTILGKTGYWLVPTLTEAAPTATQVNAGGALNVTCFLLSDQATPSLDTSKVTLPRTLCESTTTEVLDEQKATIPDFRFLWDPQADAADNDKKAWELLKDGFDGYLVRRQNVVTESDSTVAAGQYIDWFKVESKKPMPDETATDATGLYIFDVAFSCTGFDVNLELA